MEKKDFLTKYAKHLNENQLKAVQAVEGPVLLLAVPGSGKTTVLVTRLGYMMFCEGIAPEHILTLTYTIAATNDMARRFASIFGEEYGGRLEFRTINGICAKVIQRYAQMIGKPAFELLTDEKKIGMILTDILMKNRSEYPTESDVKGARTLITYCKNMLLDEEKIAELGKREGMPLPEIFREYNQYLRDNRLMDYDDQMIYAYRLLKGSPELLRFFQEKYRYLCVDEAQDTSKIQHIIISLLAGEKGNLFLVGDEDQSIYGFRAAYPEALLHFEEEHPGAQVLVMNQNYRSNARIVAAADRLIQKNQERHDKHMVAVKAADKEIDYIDLRNRSSQYGYLLKVAKNCSRETAVLYRDNESVLPLIDQLDRQQMPFRIKNMDMTFFTHRVVTDITNIMRFAMEPYNTELFLRIYFKCQTYLKKSQAEQMCRISMERKIPVLDAADYVESMNGMVLGKCRAFATHLKNMLKEAPEKALFRIEKPLGYREYLERNNMDGNKLFLLKMLAYPEVSVGSFLDRLIVLQNMLKDRRQDFDCPFILSTIHSSKGLEYDRVYLMDVCDGVFPNQAVRPTASASAQEKKELEEERRLFYVGVTRAKNELHLFRLADTASCFIREMKAPEPAPTGEKQGCKTVYGNPDDKSRNLPQNFELVIGERVVQVKYGAGVVSDVEYDNDGQAGKFTVTFDSGEDKSFIFPIAFKVGMCLESDKE